MTDPNIWNQLLIWPILNLLITFYKGLEFLHVPGAFGFAIIGLTVLVRLILSPLTHAQLKSARKMQNLKPQLDALNKKHGADKVKLQQAQLALYKEAGVNPAAGCFPLLLQIPIFIALYNVFIQVLKTNSEVQVVESINKVLYSQFLYIKGLDLNFLGINLTTKPNQWQQYGIWLLAIPLITALLQYVQTRLMTSATPPALKTSEKGTEDQMLEMQKQMALMMPVMIGVFALSFPIGLALYWNATTVFGIIQQLQINKKHS